MALKFGFDTSKIINDSIYNFLNDIKKFYENYYTFLVIFTILLGAFIRFLPLLLIGLPQEIPFNGGGLYYSFSVSIIENYFHYPINIPYYSTLGVPFAYNPLVFYFVAFLATYLKISPFILHIYLPTIFSIISLVLFYIFARSLFQNKNIVITSTFFYCILPNAFSELIFGEGLVESFGTMLYLIGVIFLFHIYDGGKYKYCIFSGILFGIIILGSPGGALAFAITLMIIPFFKENFKSAIKTIFSVSIIGAIVSAPWWMTVIYYHGINSITNGVLWRNPNILTYLFKILGFNTGCGWLFGTILVLLGFIYCLILRKWLFPIWFFFIFLASTREIGYIVPVIAALLMAIGLIKVILPSLNFLESSKTGHNIFTSIFLILICIHGVGTALYYNTEFHFTETDIPVSYNKLRDAEINGFSAISWAKDNSSIDSRFFIVGDRDLWWAGDWLPVLLQRPVINVDYGSEWAGNYHKIVKMKKTIIEQLRNGDIDSSEKIANEYGTYFTYIFIVKSDDTKDLITILRMNNKIKPGYENDNTIIFKVIPGTLE